MVINSCSIPDDAKVGISTSAADAYYKSLAPAPPPPMAPPPPPAPGKDHAKFGILRKISTTNCYPLFIEDNDFNVHLGY